MSDERFRVIQADCIEFMNGLEEDSVDLVFGSPPYCDARTYGIDVCYDCQRWVDWMLQVSEAAIRVSKGLVLWVVAGVQRKNCYWPACEGLQWEWWKRNGHLWCPCVWWKVNNAEGGAGIPGSGGRQGLRKDWEYVVMFKRPGVLPWSDNTAMGHPPVYDYVGCGPTRQRDGTYDKGGRSMPKIANPGNVLSHLPEDEFLRQIVKACVGGGHIGSSLSHLGEAPFPEKLAEFFIRSYCPPGGVVLDPFMGSGTTAAVALRHGRRALGCDIRESQIELTRRRVSGETLPLFREL